MTPTETIASTALQTVLAVAQALAITNPKVAAAVALAPLVTELLNAVEQMKEAGTLTPEALIELFQSIGADIQTAHNEWVVMNVADAARAP